MRCKVRRSAVLSTLPLLLVAASVIAADATYEFDLRGDSLNAALKQFAAQSDLQIAYFTHIAEGKSAPAVSGRLTAEQALSALLQSSGLTFERIGDNVMAIRAMQSGAADESVLRETEPEPPEVEPEEPAAGAGVMDLGGVVVTGSHIRGVINDTAPIMTFDREYIERSGYSNMMQLVESLPMNFKGGQSGSTEVAQFGDAPNYGQNLTRGTGFNLRGLGSVSTLTLVDGRRLAPSAQGQFVDVSTIPLAAVDRIEILSDGASAIYGADAVAGVINIILRKDFHGGEASVQYGSATDGSTDDQRLSLALGRSWRDGNALLIGEYYKRDPLDILDRDYIVDAGQEGPTYLLPRREAVSLVFSANQDLPGSFDAATNILYSYEEVDSLDATGNGTVAISQSPITNRWSAAFGLGYEPFSDWRFSLDANVGRTLTKTDMIYTDVATGEPVLLIRDYHDKFDTWMVDLKGDGTLLELPGGAVRLAVGGGYREEDLISTRVRVIPPTGPEVRADDSRQVGYAFAEVHVPIVGRRQELSWARRLELSLAARYDDYSDFGSTSNPKMGIVWSPVDSLDLRASFSTSFRAPSVAEKAIGARGQQISTATLDAPDGSGAQVPMFYLLGSTELGPEESQNMAVGFTYRPALASGMELSINYFDIDYKDRITTAPFDAGALMRRDDYGDLIIDIPDDAAAQAYLDERIALGDLFIDWMGSDATGVRYVMDLRQQNAARVRMSGFDVTGRYGFSVGDNHVDLHLNATHIRRILTSLTDDTNAFDQVDTYNQPLDWRFRALGTWTRGGLGVTISVNHADGYVNNSQAVDVPIASWTTMDVNLSYDFDRGAPAAALRGARISFGVSNLTDADPPRAISPMYPVGFDAFNADPMGRYATVRLSKRW